MLSRNIFQVWFQGCDKVHNDAFLENMKNWKLLNPEWNYYCLSDKELKIACKEYSQECLDAYERFDIMHMKIDLGRYVMLYHFGGIYVDMDAFVMRSLDSSIDVHDVLKNAKGKHVLGLSRMNLNMLESFLYSGYTEKLNNGIMMASAHNPLLKDFIDEIISDKKIYQSQYEKVASITGPKHFNIFFQPYIKNPPTTDIYIKVFTNDVFEPCKYKHCNITNKTISIHTMDSTWLPSSMKISAEVYYAIRNYIVPVLLFFCIIYICFYCFPFRTHTGKNK